jgi:hypothetical protein
MLRRWEESPTPVDSFLWYSVMPTESQVQYSIHELELCIEKKKFLLRKNGLMRSRRADGNFLPTSD